VQTAFLTNDAFQCGFCTPGMILTAYALLKKNPRPNRQQVIEAMEGNLCRCGTNGRILDAVQEASQKGGSL
jgi:aerobic-type carbon monoxide dehydrogenase small subunit (CoxS/CutS family)